MPPDATSHRIACCPDTTSHHATQPPPLAVLPTGRRTPPTAPDADLPRHLAGRPQQHWIPSALLSPFLLLPPHLTLSSRSCYTCRHGHVFPYRCSGSSHRRASNVRSRLPQLDSLSGTLHGCCVVTGLLVRGSSRMAIQVIGTTGAEALREWPQPHCARGDEAADVDNDFSSLGTCDNPLLPSLLRWISKIMEMQCTATPLAGQIGVDAIWFSRHVLCSASA
ncbi:hypothetical protein D1007_36179 [Hordeum vulgare]|nr:hypothetical protein D1007_36179 [Hordeum vulgare]KAI4980196.1 hypothetical protein ZWY2020_020681 [Hordeum vulgare]